MSRPLAPMMPAVTPPLRTRSWLLVFAMLATSTHAVLAQAPATASTTAPPVVIEDVERFYRIYDATDGKPTVEQLQHDYLDQGTEGLHHFARHRRVTGEAIATTLDKRPELYKEARECMHVMPQVKQRLSQSLHALATLYPE
ncbi:MAG TPA: hypothetical protein VLF15_10900, partial [Pseudoxanthomonas sp.]|nr:hypothetical protein [Pseudoxanthomonas sp.]